MRLPRSLMKRMNFSWKVSFTLLVAGVFSACKTPEPRDPRESIPEDKEYYNEALGFSLRYPNLLNLKVEEKEGTDVAGIALMLQYPGNDFTVFELTTRNPGWKERLRKHLVAGSEMKEDIGGLEAEGFDIQLTEEDDEGPNEGTRKRVILEHLDRLYVFTGRGETFDEVLRSFALIEAKDEAKDEATKSLEQSPAN